jgi:hypothetical protein
MTKLFASSESLAQQGTKSKPPSQASLGVKHNSKDMMPSKPSIEYVVLDSKDATEGRVVMLSDLPFKESKNHELQEEIQHALMGTKCSMTFPVFVMSGFMRLALKDPNNLKEWEESCSASCVGEKWCEVFKEYVNAGKLEHRFLDNIPGEPCQHVLDQMLQKYADSSQLVSWNSFFQEARDKSDFLGLAHKWWVTERGDIIALTKSMICLPASSFVLWMEMSRLHLLIFSESLNSADSMLVDMFKLKHIVKAGPEGEDVPANSTKKSEENATVIKSLKEIISAPKISLKLFEMEVTENHYSDRQKIILAILEER